MKHLHIAIALIWQDGKVLATRRRDDADHLAGWWEFPGGKCQEGEAPQACALREVDEEIGVRVEITGERTSITHTYPERRVTLYPFDCTIVEGNPQLLQVADMRWIKPHELRAEEFPPANLSLIEAIKIEVAR